MNIKKRKFTYKILGLYRFLTFWGLNKKLHESNLHLLLKIQKKLDENMDLASAYILAPAR